MSRELMVVEQPDFLENGDLDPSAALRQVYRCYGFQLPDEILEAGLIVTTQTGESEPQPVSRDDYFAHALDPVRGKMAGNKGLRLRKLTRLRNMLVFVFEPMGDIVLGNMGACFFSCYNTPNSSNIDQPEGPCPQDAGDTGYFAPCHSLGAPTYGAAGDSALAQTAARSKHTGGVNVGLADGSVRFVSKTVDSYTWRALGTISGGEILDSSF